jgi:hypothetical protein
MESLGRLATDSGRLTDGIAPICCSRLPADVVADLRPLVLQQDFAV